MIKYLLTMKRLFIMILVMASVIACEKDNPMTDSSSDSSQTTDDSSDDSKGTGDDTVTPVVDDNKTDDVLTISDFSKTVHVTWNGTAATITGADGVIDCSASGGHVTIGSSSSSVEGLDIVLSGTSTDGALKVYNSQKFVITLDGVTLTSKTGAAIDCQSKKETFILLSAGTTNTLADASSYSDVPSGEDCKGCIFSEGQLVFTGSGSLKISGNCSHAIASDDYIRLYSGSVYVTAAAADAVHVKDYLRMDAGTLDLTAAKDGIECDEGYINIVGGNLTVKSVGDAVKTSYEGTSTDVTPYVNIAGGTVNLTATGEKGMGVKSVGDVIVSGGDLTISVSGAGAKAIKSDNNVAISGGTLVLTTSGNSMYDTEDKDTSSPCCIKAENLVTISGGSITSTSTGSGGKCVNCYGFTMGSGTLSATTSGTSYTYGSLSCKPKAIKATKLITVNGGEITVKTSGKLAEGMESKGDMTVNDGKISIQAYDDAINTEGVYTQNGGYVYAYSTNNDAVDSNNGKSGSIVIGGGVLMAQGTTSPDEGIDADNNSFITIKGGTVFSSGGQQNASGSPSCSQPCVYIQNYSLSTGYYTVTDASGNVIMSCKVPRAMSQCYSFVSSSSFTSGGTYKYGVVSSAPASATTSWNPLYYAGGTVSGTLSSSFTAGSGYTSVGTSGGQTGPGGGQTGPGGGGRP